MIRTIRKEFFNELIYTDLHEFMKKRGYVTVKDLIEETGRPESTIRDRIRKGKYPGSVKIGHMHFVPKHKNKYRDDWEIQTFSRKSDEIMHHFGYVSTNDAAFLENVSTDVIKDRIKRNLCDSVKVGMFRYIDYSSL